MKKLNQFSSRKFNVFSSYWCSFTGFGYFSLNFGGFLKFWENLEIKDGGSKMAAIRQLLRYMTSSLRDADLKGDIFRRTIYPLSLTVILCLYTCEV